MSMTNPFATSAAQNFGLLLARSTLGAYFAVSGYNNVMAGVGNFARTHMPMLPGWCHPRGGEVFLTLYPVNQLVFGVLLACGVLTRLSAFCLAATLILFLTCIVGLEPAKGLPFEPNIIFCAVAIALLTNGGGKLTLPALFGKKVDAPGAPKPAAPK